MNHRSIAVATLPDRENVKSEKKGRRRRIEAPEVRRTQILEAAKRCFRKSGFHGTQIAAIAEEAGISVGLVYRYFPGKEALIEEISRQDMLAQKDLFTDVLSPDTGDPDAMLDRLLEAIVATIFDHERTALMLEITHQAVRNARIRAFASEVQDETVELIRARLKIEDAVTPEELSARLQILGGLMSGTAVQFYGQSGEPDPLVLDLLKRSARQVLLPSSGRSA